MSLTYLSAHCDLSGVILGALNCYTCDTDGEPDCITDPEDYTQSQCKSTETYCYTYRIETGTGSNSEMGKWDVLL